jgi:hypothetical protein
MIQQPSVWPSMAKPNLFSAPRHLVVSIFHIGKDISGSVLINSIQNESPKDLIVK